jgi:diacylglycerol kinase family enzyme
VKEKTTSVKTLFSRAPMIEIGKRPFYGNQFRICPGAEPSEGPMELILFDFKRKFSVMLHVLPLWMGWHRLINRMHRNNGEAPIKHYRVDSCTIRVNKPFDFHVDGELAPQNPRSTDEYAVSITMLRRAVTFLVPKRYFLHHVTTSEIATSSNEGMHNSMQ